MSWLDNRWWMWFKTASTELDVVNANDYLKKAVEHDMAASNKRLSRCTEAIEWYQRATDNGDINALFLLARHYEAGAGVAKDMEMAATLYNRAGDNGHKVALLYLALCRSEDAVIAGSFSTASPT
jgi:TPR repeat protein